MSNPSQVPEQKDPLSSLYKMSRTAGLGSHEYVAVNPTAVVALLLGLASGLAVLGTVMLVVPVAAVIVAFLAILQVRHSAGTQTGKGLAILGLLLAVGFVLLVGGQAIVHAREVEREKGQILSLIDSLGKNIVSSNYEAAYGQFGPRFHSAVTQPVFVNTWTQNQSNPSYGHIKGMRSNGIVDLDPEDILAYTNILIELPGGLDRRLAILRKIPEQGWVIEDLQGYFPTAPTAPAAAQPQ